MGLSLKHTVFRHITHRLLCFEVSSIPSQVNVILLQNFLKSFAFLMIFKFMKFPQDIFLCQ